MNLIRKWIVDICLEVLEERLPRQKPLVVRIRIYNDKGVPGWRIAQFVRPEDVGKVPQYPIQFFESPPAMSLGGIHYVHAFHELDMQAALDNLGLQNLRFIQPDVPPARIDDIRNYPRESAKDSK